MNAVYYKAAMQGQIGTLLQDSSQLEVQLTPNHNTVLHVACLFGQTECAIEILKNCPCLLFQLNSRKESPLNIASREGLHEIVEAFIRNNDLPATDESGLGGGSINDLLRLCNVNGYTALHEAVRYQHLKVIRLLAMKDPEYSHPPSKAGETPLYLAAERGYEDCVRELLHSCKSPSYSGPGDRTALHAAVISDSQGISEALFHWKPELSKHADQKGWTPLHYATCLGREKIVRMLLESDRSLAYIRAANDNNNTALHVAASRGHTSVMKELLLCCPDCVELVNDQGKNFLHSAIENGWQDAIDFILESPFLSLVINQEDVDGNTPLHLLGSKWFMSNLRKHDKADNMAFNKQNLTPVDIALLKYPNRYLFGRDLTRKSYKLLTRNGHEILGSRLFETLEVEDKKNFVKREFAPTTVVQAIDRGDFDSPLEAKSEDPAERIRKGGETNMIVAALMVTVTFTAGFTMPGGFNGDEDTDQGMAILSKRLAFQVFIIADTIALIFSTGALLLQFFIASDEVTDIYYTSFINSMELIGCALCSMIVAFIAGTYSVLENSAAIAIATCVTGSLSFLFFFFLLGKVSYKTIKQELRYTR